MAEGSPQEEKPRSQNTVKKNLFTSLKDKLFSPGSYRDKNNDNKEKVSSRAGRYRYKGDRVYGVRAFNYFAQSAEGRSYDDKWNNIAKLGAYAGTIKGVLFKDKLIAWSGINDFMVDHVELAQVEYGVDPALFFTVRPNDEAPHIRIDANATDRFDISYLQMLGDYFNRSIFENKGDVLLELKTDADYKETPEYQFTGTLEEYNKIRQKMELHLGGGLG